MKYFKIKCRKTFLFVICFFMVVFTIGVVSCTNDVNEDSIADENDSAVVFIESSISVNQMDSLSNVINGKLDGLEPVAIIVYFESMISEEPSFFVTLI